MSNPTRSFAFYPPAIAAEKFDYDFKEDKNPALRGLPMVLAASLVTSFSFVPRLLFKNAGFTEIKHMPELRDKEWRALSLVIPLADRSTTPKPLEFDSEHSEAQLAALPGRFHSSAEYVALYKSGTLTPLQVVNGLLPLISDRTRSDHGKAWVEIHADEVRAAASASTKRWAEGKPLGPLDGVPFGVKCDTEMRGFVRTLGLKPDVRKYPRAFRTQDKTAWCVAKLVEAGAVPLGTLAMHELGIDVNGCNPVLGTPRNWYNKEYYPGGSSSGAGSAIGSGVIPFAVGTDAAGSLRIPAAFNGCYSIKPTFGRIEYKHASVCVTGPMAATVADLGIAYRIMAQANPTDPLGSQFAPSVPPVKGEGKRYIGVCRPWVATAVPVVLQTFNNTLNFLAKAGYEVIDIDLPYLQQGHRALNALCLSEASERAKARVENPAEWLDMPNAANRIYLSVGAVAEAHDYVRWGMLREAIMQHLASLWEKYPGMLILTPTTPEVGWKAQAGDQKYGFSDGNCTTRNVSFCWLSNFSGCPSTQCPMGYGEPEQGEGKVPVGIMAMGEWGEEERLLGFARDMETWLNDGHEGGRLRPKEWVDTLELAANAGAGDAKAAEDSDGMKATSK